MNRLSFALFGVVCAVLPAMAECTVSSVSVSQEWPWSPKVQIAVVLSGEGKTDIALSATWAGRSEPLELYGMNGLEGDTFQLSAGTSYLAWDPRAAGVTDTLEDFAVTVETSASNARKYLVVDLVNGSYEYMAEVPSGGFTQDVYKTTKMAFRRIPATTFTMGLSDDYIDGTLGSSSCLNFSATQKQGLRAHQVTLSSDYYMAIFPTTRSQYANVNGDSSVTSKRAVSTGATVSVVRGDPFDETSPIQWPTTAHRVADDSWLAKLRAKCNGALLFDLPTEAQWENAARCGTTTLFDIGGAANDDFETVIKPLIQRVAMAGSETDVGLLEANAFGLYNTSGFPREACLDVANDTLSDATDPIGGVPAGGGKDRIVLKGGLTTPNYNSQRIPENRSKGAYKDETSDINYSFRVCIHLKPLRD